MVDIVIPIYKPKPSPDDWISLHQCFKILGNHSITFVHPKSLDVKEYKIFEASFLGFDDFYFNDILGYNSLMLNKEFYASFQKKYLLIYQTDCFVFQDNLDFWCQKNYDYIGAPWLRSSSKIPFIKLIFDKSICFIKKQINFRGNARFQKDKSLLYNAVGNGGLSLRKREKFIEIIDVLQEGIKVYLDPKNQSSYYAEDVFFSTEPERNGILLAKPNYKEACGFSMENKQRKAMDYNHGKLPFGCHRWNKEKDFWRDIFKTHNIQI